MPVFDFSLRSSHNYLFSKQTEAVLRQALAERVRVVLVINKVLSGLFSPFCCSLQLCSVHLQFDRLLAELQLDDEAIFQKLQGTINAINAIIEVMLMFQCLSLYHVCVYDLALSLSLSLSLSLTLNCLVSVGVPTRGPGLHRFTRKRQRGFWFWSRALGVHPPGIPHSFSIAPPPPICF